MINQSNLSEQFIAAGGIDLLLEESIREPKQTCFRVLESSQETQVRALSFNSSQLRVDTSTVSQLVAFGGGLKACSLFWLGVANTGLIKTEETISADNEGAAKVLGTESNESVDFFCARDLPLAGKAR